MGFDANPTESSLGEAGPSKVHQLTSTICEPELVVHTFENGAGIRLRLGNLHITIPHGSTVSLIMRERIVQEAMQRLESDVPSDSATQPVVLVLVGDCILSRQLAEDATQKMQPKVPGWRTVWHVHATTAELSGDLIFVKGALAKSFDIPFGKSHRDRGVRNDDHDASGIELRVIVKSEPEPLSKRLRFAPQLARDDDGACQPGDAPQLDRDDDDASQPARELEK